VVLDAASLSDGEMLSITREMSYSETSFVLGNGSGGFNVRIFTPEGEIPFAGHPTLGTAFVILKEVLQKPRREIVLNLKGGRVPVRVEGGSKGGSGEEFFWMTHPEGNFGETLSKEQAALALNVESGDLMPNAPVIDVSTGFPYFVVPLRNLEALARAAVNTGLCAGLTAETRAKAFLLFCPEALSEKNDLTMRVFCHYYGIPEDPATGSAAGCLGEYLLKYDLFRGEGIDIRAEQGHQVKRPSLLRIRGRRGERVSVGGRIFKVASGSLL